MISIHSKYPLEYLQSYLHYLKLYLDVTNFNLNVIKEIIFT